MPDLLLGVMTGIVLLSLLSQSLALFYVADNLPCCAVLRNVLWRMNW